MTQAAGKDLSAWKAVVVGVADLDKALELWIDDFGLQVVERATGPDRDLAALWEISADDISRQALVRNAGVETGMLHLVEFVDPAPAVRAGAEVFDFCPKNLDVYVQDLPEKFTALRESGRTFRTSDYSEVTSPGGITFREVHMPSHDDINVVLLEVLGSDQSYSPKGFSAVGPLITIVPDAEVEKAFFRDVIDVGILTENILQGPEIEKMIGLPPGSALDVSIWGREKYELGQIEIIEYGGVSGRNLYPRARPKALGVLHVAYTTGDLDPILQRLGEHSIPYAEYPSVTTMLGSGRAVSFHSPAGLRIEVHERS